MLPQADDVAENARFYLYLDEDWETVLAADTCNDKLALAKWSSSSLRGQFHPLRHTVSQVSGWAGRGVVVGQPGQRTGSHGHVGSRLYCSRVGEVGPDSSGSDIGDRHIASAASARYCCLPVCPCLLL